ncbi:MULTISPECIES: DUF748 domain-containing protein [Microbulbifer]|uniref:DUF748 domain-containing protein n=1 Tax=Microbulbifer TaxID=48073 RepID=UPI001E28AFC8|nr:MULTISPECIES: DUF748 domain-containing protein [Microbulbifer]UHQ56827.1 DUF748 domain-containing protein [Microbulbifer sp. YPW16]
MPKQSAQQSPDHVARLLWLVVGIVVVTGLLQLVLAMVLEQRLETWLEQRGYRADIGYLHLSIADLRVEIHGVELRNREGRGLRARELMLDYSWWQLLRRRMHFQRAWLDGVEFDLESRPGEQVRRIWEVAGWDLGEGGQKRDRDFQLLIDQLYIRDSQLCYRAREAWKKPNCLQFSRLSAQDWRLSLHREGDTPLQVEVAAGKLSARDLLVREQGSRSIHTVLVGLDLTDALFARPGTRITAVELVADRFGSCLPQEWADAFPAFGRIIGHCGIARRLQLEGDLSFSFGSGAQVGWLRGNGQGVILRRSDRRWPDWRAETLDINQMEYSRSASALAWQQGGATAFDWCPPAWRRPGMHYCVRAGSMNLPDPTTIDWQNRLVIHGGPVDLRQVQLLDVAGANNDPLTAHSVFASSLEYRGKSRRLSLDAFQLESASGCLPGRLWGIPDYCGRLAGLKTPERLGFRFPDSTRDLPLGASSGPLRLGQLQLWQKPAAGRRGEQKQLLELEALRWQRLNLLGGETPYLVQDFSLAHLSGCVPDAALPKDLRPLCGRAQHLQGRGSFAWQGGEAGYLVAGELVLERLLLADGLHQPTGLLLTGLHGGPAMLRLAGGERATGPGTGRAGGGASPGSPAGDGEFAIGAEKGLLPEELARSRREADGTEEPDGPGTTSLDNPNLKVEEFTLAQLQGCLPPAWEVLLYRNSAGMPTCFEMDKLEQESELRLAWGGGLLLQAGDTSAERVLATTRGGRELLYLEALEIPAAKVLLPAAGPRLVELPGMSLEAARGCRPRKGSRDTGNTAECARLEDLALGNSFSIRADARQLAMDLGESRLGQARLLGAEDEYLAGIEDARVGLLKLDWSRPDKMPDRLRAQDVAVAEVHGCLPESVSLRPGLPRCGSVDDVRLQGSDDAAELRLGETVMKTSPVARPLWRFESARVAELGLDEEALLLRNLELREVQACGMRELLPPAVRARGVGDCIVAPRLEFTGVSRIGLGAAAPMVELAALQPEPIRLWQEGGDFARFGVDQLGWQRLRWSGGTELSVTDFRLGGFVGCDTGPVARAVEQVAEALEPPATEPCIRLRSLSLPGRQQLSLAGPFGSDGAIELDGLVISGRAGRPLEIRQLRLDQLSYGGESPFISLAGASGCLSADWFPGTGLTPCYQLGEIRVERRGVDPANGASTIYGLTVGEGRFTQDGFPSGLPSGLLLFDSLGADRVYLGEGLFAVDGLLLDTISGCLPRGYVAPIHHCFTLGRLDVDGSYRAGDQYLQLAKLDANELLVLGTDGRELVRATEIHTAQAVLREGEIGIPWLEASELGFLGRHEEAPEFKRHGWDSEVRQLRAEQVTYSTAANALEISDLEIERPKLILFRDKGGDFPIEERFGKLLGVEGEPEPATAERRPFRYRLHHATLQGGRFTWLDRQGQFRARLPIRQIYVKLENAGNYPEDDPATIVLKGRPGGYGELQLAGTLDYLATEKWNASLTASIANANLIPATPYMANLLGYKILQGQLDAVVDIIIHENKVDAVADMRLNKIRVRRVRDSDQLSVEESMIPLNVALYLLRDGKGDVRFTMPVTGNLYDPSFSFSFIFSELLQRAILEALFSYFTPLGFYSLGQLAWQRLMAVDFDPIEFAPGSAELNDAARRQLDEVVETLQERPEARPGICGIANARDWHALDPQTTPPMWHSRRTRETLYRYPPIEKLEELERLARRRSRAVARFLIEAGISADEFIQCAPDYNGRDFDEPRVEFSS